MERLRASDLHRLLQVLHELEEIERPADFPAGVMAALAALIPADSFSYNEVDLAKRRVWVVSNHPEVARPEEAALFARLTPQHPLITYYQATGDPQPLKISDFLGRTSFHRLALYQEFYRRVGVEYQLALTIPSTAPVVIGLAFNRGECDFSESERAVLGLARPHLTYLRNVLLERALLREQLDALQRGASTTGDEVAVLDRQLRLRFATPRALRWLSEGSERRRRDSRALAEPLASWVRAQLGKGAGDDLGHPPVPLLLQRNGLSVRVRLLPAGRPDGDRVLIVEEWPPNLTRVGASGAGASLGPPDPVSAPPGDAPEPVPLTPRERDVAALLARGYANRQIAAALTITEGTTRLHVKHILGKLGLASRLQAAIWARERGLAAAGVDALPPPVES
jgi:DNA-binding CsgD family transcriptional regulator